MCHSPNMDDHKLVRSVMNLLVNVFLAIPSVTVLLLCSPTSCMWCVRNLERWCPEDIATVSLHMKVSS